MKKTIAQVVMKTVSSSGRMFGLLMSLFAASESALKGEAHAIGEGVLAIGLRLMFGLTAVRAMVGNLCHYLLFELLVEQPILRE